MSPAVTAGLLPASAAEGFPALEFIRDPGEARIMFADSFNDGRLLWLFPFLSFSQSRNITGWVFRVKPAGPAWSPGAGNMPSFELWQESSATVALDYACVHCTDIVIKSTEPYVEGSNFVYKQVLETPLVVTASSQYILGIRLPPAGPENLQMAFQRMETVDRLSYFFTSNTTFVNIRNVTYQDNRHIPLVSPLYGKSCPSMYSIM